MFPPGAFASERRSHRFVCVRQYSDVLLCFVDESFKPDLYGFGAVVADARQTRELTARVQQIVSSLAEYGVDERTEIHAHPIFHGKERWDDVPPRVRVKVFIDVVEAVRDSGAVVLLRGVRSGHHRDGCCGEDLHRPEHVAFQHVLQWVDRIAAERDTHALVIADERADRERHRERFAVFQAYGTPGTYMHSRLERLLDTVHFAPSHHSRMLQIADLVAFVWVRSLTVTERDLRQRRVIAALVAEIERCSQGAGLWP